MKKWIILNKLKFKSEKLKVSEVIKILLGNRGIKNKKAIEEFLNPKLENVTVDRVGIDKKQLKKAILRIKDAIKKKEQIVVYGDYDVDGICGTAILWETLNNLGAYVVPYIPHRIDEGYGLSVKGISNIKNKILNIKLIITVDNGIVANKAVEFANKNGIDVIITDHHTLSKTKPSAHAIVHTTELCGAGVAYLLSQNIKNQISKIKNNREDSHLELVALATVADLVLLKGVNRTLLKFGLEKLRETKRVGLLALFREAGINNKDLGVYEIGHIIAPRLNAMGRLEYAMDSLRLLCTNNIKRAHDLAKLLGETNRQRQDLTLQTVLHAKNGLKLNGVTSKKLLFLAHETYEQGVIGLVAGKMVDEYYRPSIVVSIGEKLSKASARSISGFNIIEFIRQSSSYLVDAGGHPMAAGFTVETEKLIKLQEDLERKAELLLNEEMLTRTLKIDCELPLSFINESLYSEIQKMSPFGMENPEPVFVSREVMIESIRLVGRDGRHLKLNIKYQKSKIKNDEFKFDAIAFGMGERFSEFQIGDKVDIVYTIDEDTWNGNKKLQLKVNDIRL